VKWPWQRRDARGTLTLLDEGGIVLGLPDDMEISPQQFENIRSKVVQWVMAKNQTLVLPFPVDVKDCRTEKPDA